MVDLLEQYSIEDLAEIIEERKAGFIVLFPAEVKALTAVFNELFIGEDVMVKVDEDDIEIVKGIIERGTK